MSWGVKIVGVKRDVVRALRSYKDRPNMYQDAQRDAVLNLAADQIEASGETYGGGVLVEGSGHVGSNFNVKLEFCEVALAEPEPARPIPQDSVKQG